MSDSKLRTKFRSYQDGAVDLAPLTYDTYFTPRGTEVEALGYVVEREDLFLLALQEIDNLNFHIELPGWRIKILEPKGTAVVDLNNRVIEVRWRSDHHFPRDQTLPRLKELMDMASIN
jgi:hypothetical protein